MQETDILKHNFNKITFIPYSDEIPPIQDEKEYEVIYFKFIKDSYLNGLKQNQGWFKNQLHYIQNLSYKDRALLAQYTTSVSEIVQKPHNHERINELIRSSPPLDSDLIVFRGGWTLPNCYPRILSTSLHLRTAVQFSARNNNIFLIRLPKGFPCLFISFISGYSLTEYEVLLPRYISIDCYKIQSMNFTMDNIYRGKMKTLTYTKNIIHSMINLSNPELCKEYKQRQLMSNEQQSSRQMRQREKMARQDKRASKVRKSKSKSPGRIYNKSPKRQHSSQKSEDKLLSTCNIM